MSSGAGEDTTRLRSEKALAWVQSLGPEVTLEVKRRGERRGPAFWDVNWAISQI